MSISAATPILDGNELLHRCLALHALRGRRELLELPLRPEQEAELEALGRWFAERAREQQPPPDGPFPTRADARLPVEVAIELRLDDGSRRAATVRNVSASGLYLASAALGPPGERASLRFLDERAGREWRFVGEVAWARALTDGVRGGGLRIVGVPLELRVGVRGDPGSAGTLPDGARPSLARSREVLKVAS